MPQTKKSLSRRKSPVRRAKSPSLRLAFNAKRKSPVRRAKSPVKRKSSVRRAKSPVGFAMRTVRSLCINEEDPITLDPISRRDMIRLPPRNAEGKLHCFNKRSLLSLVRINLLRGEHLPVNPVTRTVIPLRTLVGIYEKNGFDVKTFLKDLIVYSSYEQAAYTSGELDDPTDLYAYYPEPGINDYPQLYEDDVVQIYEIFQPDTVREIETLIQEYYPEALRYL